MGLSSFDSLGKAKLMNSVGMLYLFVAETGTSRQFTKTGVCYFMSGIAGWGMANGDIAARSRLHLNGSIGTREHRYGLAD
jgi:hypothetical protein